MEIKKLLILAGWFSFILPVMFFMGCAASLKIDLVKDTNIKFIKTYQELTTEKWQKTDILVQQRESVTTILRMPISV